MSFDETELADLFTNDLFDTVLDAHADTEVSDLFAVLADLDDDPAFDWSRLDVEDSIESARAAKLAAARGIASIAAPAPGAREQWIDGGRRLDPAHPVSDDAIWELFASDAAIDGYRAEHPTALFTIMTPDQYAGYMGTSTRVYYERVTHAGKEADEARVEALNAEAPAATDLLAQRLAFKRADAEADRIIAAEAYDGLGGVVSWDELEDLADISWLVPDLIAFGETALLVAKRNVGKSMLAMALGFSIAAGLDSFLGRRIQQGKVLFILGEGSRGIAKRMNTWCAANGIDPELVKANTVVFKGGNLSNDASLSDLKLVASQLQPALVIIDTYSSVSGIADEVKPALAAEVVNRVKEIAPDAAKLLLHHPNGETENTTAPKSRGGSTLPSNVDTVITMWADRGHAVAGLPGQEWVAISTEEEHEGKQKDDVRLTIRGLRIASKEGGAYLDWHAGDSLTRSDRWVTEHVELGETVTVPGLVASTGQARNTIRGHLRSSRLVRDEASASGSATSYTRIG